MLNKPAGLKVHPGPGGGPSVEDWFPHLSRRRDGPWLAHRLDADTAGCLVVALRRAALIEAQACFAGGQAGKLYWAVVLGEPPAAEGFIEAPLRKHVQPGGWRIEIHPEGQAARTLYRRLGGTGRLSWLELRLLTGRTHQARVHCALALGTPLLGDALYGNPGGGLHLLARHIELPLHPPLLATAPPPPHMHAALLQCGWAGSIEAQPA